MIALIAHQVPDQKSQCQPNILYMEARVLSAKHCLFYYITPAVEKYGWQYGVRGSNNTSWKQNHTALRNPGLARSQGSGNLQNEVDTTCALQSPYYLQDSDHSNCLKQLFEDQMILWN